MIIISSLTNTNSGIVLIKTTLCTRQMLPINISSHPGQSQKSIQSKKRVTETQRQIQSQLIRYL